MMLRPIPLVVPDCEVLTLSREEMIENLTELIRDTVGEATDWSQNGGNIASLREMNCTLIVNALPFPVNALRTLVQSDRAVALAGVREL